MVKLIKWWPKAEWPNVCRILEGKVGREQGGEGRENRRREGMSVISVPTEPAIFIEGHTGYHLTFPPNEASGNFIVRIYTTSEVQFLDVVSNDQEEVEVTVIFRSYPTFEVVARFEIRIPLAEDGEEQSYIIHAQTEEKKIAIQEITVVKAESKEGSSCSSDSASYRIL